MARGPPSIPFSSLHKTIINTQFLSPGTWCVFLRATHRLFHVCFSRAQKQKQDPKIILNFKELSWLCSKGTMVKTDVRCFKLLFAISPPPMTTFLHVYGYACVSWIWGNILLCCKGERNSTMVCQCRWHYGKEILNLLDGIMATTYWNCPDLRPGLKY